MQQQPKVFTLAELAEQVGGDVQGNGEISLSGVSTLSSATGTQISFLTNSKYRPQLQHSQAGAVILHANDAADCPLPALVHKNPHAAFARIAQIFDTTPGVAVGQHATAVVAKSAILGSNVALGPHCVIEDGVELGDNVVIGANTVISKNAKIGAGSVIHPNVTVYHSVRIGKRVRVHSQTVIGADGFGYANDAGTWLPIPQTGSVVIGDDSQIGASTTIDRGALDDTIIGKNVIIDNQVQVGHNCVIGDHSCICGSTGIAGSTHIGKYVIIAGHCGVNGHLTICDKVQITGFTMVTSDINEPGVYSSGQPAMTNREWRKNAVRARQLDQLFDRVKQLEKQK
ncbi:UDP-3-O-(3-hydroxymyristoyl)glucosamine N-acyltransferase [Aestuariibacter sp. GS-14]|uniref:UDP-3-O-(3-hydroxymyristoyl)glucosamine N-acyltransferase n=1 Tax=Aestuariibacter sp. GS-14 TaxID=2590670 RepID=UPI0011266517|nr:UDP-3-O-(3-hydroxymyristoyl)glucosamine N-acyltransferase [Aestuariibacter sp. GS-14]TPV53730.1 UDP-3-O-(3-hydroxymyristoyl)glucosamine N-acyltransferase [Aestuariibacter sp. GS-14]